MSDLLEDRAGAVIGIAVTDRRGFQGRCSLGTVAYGIGDSGYDGQALVPADDWTPLPARVAADLTAGPHAQASKIVEVVRVPDVASLDEIHRFEPFGGRYPARFLGYAECAADQLTTTTDTR